LELVVNAVLFVITLAVVALAVVALVLALAAVAALARIDPYIRWSVKVEQVELERRSSRGWPAAPSAPRPPRSASGDQIPAH
jgi:hypothetical protein